jgi:hypothetical protein
MQTEAGHGGRRVFAGLMSVPKACWILQPIDDVAKGSTISKANVVRS